ncbi:MAG TPA: Na/Pi cotransporter family protein, partial [bacterium]|nr:Na/Pi cotransporter family protein [bacterium]
IKVKVEGIDCAANDINIIFAITSKPSKSDKVYCSATKVKVNADGYATTILKDATKSGDYVVTAYISEYPEIKPVNIKINIMSKTWYIMVIVGLLGGLGVFLYGMKICAEGLQNVAGDKMKDILSKFTKTPISGYITGFFATAAVQSSSATTSMCVGFVSATLMTMVQAIAVMQGSRIGSTVTAQLIAFKIADYALLLVIAGFIMMVSSSKKKFKQIGIILIGFGFLFYGMEIMSSAMKPLRSYPDFTAMLLKLSSKPALAIIFSVAFTALIQSSAATVGLCIAFAEQNLINLETAVPLVLGAMIGTTATAILASLGANKNGKRTAVANFICAVLAVLVCSIFITYIDDIVIKITKLFGSDSIPRQVANTYTLCASFGVLVFLPFIKIFAKIVYLILPESESERTVFAPKYLAEGFANSPDVALDMAKKELLRMGGILQDILVNIAPAFEKKSETLISEIVKNDDKIDILDKAIRPYLNNIGRSGLNEEQTKLYITQLYITSYFETIGDIVVKNIVPQANKVIDKNLPFSEKEIEHLKNLTSKISELFKMCLDAFENRKLEQAESVCLLYTKLQRIAKKIHQDTFDAMRSETQTSAAQQGSLFLDTIEGLMTIAATINTIAKTIVEEL